jgi:hypothetical protein
MFEKKPTENIEEFCQGFYDRNIFHPLFIGNTDPATLFWKVKYDSILKLDHSFVEIDQVRFQKEMDAIRLVLFAFAWDIVFKEDRYTLTQSIFTRRYLERKNKSEYWDMMGEYNQAIAQSATLDENGKLMDGSVGKIQIESVNNSRFTKYNNWIEANQARKISAPKDYKYESQCVVRVVNRVGATAERADGVVFLNIASKLADRLQWKTNLDTDAFNQIFTIIYGLYKGASETIQGK